MLGMLLLVNMQYAGGTVIFLLWLVQFAVPSLREEVMWAYGVAITLGC
jgi:hypothetical protein